jgi:thiamine-phosphate pyrophosphorylase
LRVSKQKFIYLISPNTIYPKFNNDLKKILNTGKVALFQLRLKKYSLKQKLVIGKKIHQICKKNNVKFIVNDDPLLSKKLNAGWLSFRSKRYECKKCKKNNWKQNNWNYLPQFY